jgi:hypothetical protein
MIVTYLRAMLVSYVIAADIEIKFEPTIDQQCNTFTNTTYSFIRPFADSLVIEVSVN